jgi:hypothetical protein
MPTVGFDQLPGEARVWIFASDRALSASESAALLGEVDAFLAQWKAHGAPLRAAREWRDDRFLVIGVDPTHEQASGCSIDGLFRGLRAQEQKLGTSLVAGGRVFYRDASGAPQVSARKDVPSLAANGALRPESPVFDTSLTSAAAYRDRFEVPASESWVAALAGQASQSSSRAATNSSSVRNG